MEGKGYRGMVTLVSPSGERVTLEVPGRQRYTPWGSNKPTMEIVGAWRTKAKRQDRKFRRLLSAGYKVVKGQVAQQEEGKVGEDDKKDTDLVIGTTKTGDASHGGDNASCEVKDSPNHAKRGCRGGQKSRRDTDKEWRRSKERTQLRVQNAGQTGSAGVYSPQPLQHNAEILASAEKSAEMLAELVGRSQLKVQSGVSVNTEQLLVALEVGDNPLPALEAPSQRPKLRILVTPDCSGSTQGWSGLGQAWALHLAQLPEVDVIYFTNFNGELETEEEDVQKLIESVDVVLYLGDGDGMELCRHYASLGAMVLALDSYCANYANPRLKKVGVSGQGKLLWVDRVSAKVPETWAQAIALCLKN